MAADTLTAGHPAHRVKSYRLWTDAHGARQTDYAAFCGRSGTLVGHGVLG